MITIENNAKTKLTATEKGYYNAKYLYHVEEYHAYLEAEMFYGAEALDDDDKAKKAKHKNLADYYSAKMTKADNKLKINFYR